jgi:hypothetical protein
MMQEKISVTGVLTVTIIEEGKVVRTETHTNLLTSLGKRLLASWTVGILPIDDPVYNIDTRITEFALGDGNSTPAESQVSLDNELTRKALYPVADPNCGAEVEADGVALFTILIDESELNGETIREIGLFTSEGFMMSRLLTGNLVKSASVQFKFEYRYKFQVV